MPTGSQHEELADWRRGSDRIVVCVQVKAMTPQEVARLWAEYMSALMKQLQAAQGGVAEAARTAEARISALLREVLVLLMRYALCDLIKMKQFVAGKVKVTLLVTKCLHRWTVHDLALSLLPKPSNHR